MASISLSGSFDLIFFFCSCGALSVYAPGISKLISMHWVSSLSAFPKASFTVWQSSWESRLSLCNPHGKDKSFKVT